MEPEQPTKPKEQGERPPGTRPVAEREPLTVTVLDTATAEEALGTGTPVEVEVPPRVEGPWYPSNLTLGVLLAVVFLSLLYHLQFAPLILRFGHGLQRRIYGERTYEARRPKTAGQVIGPH